jgi:hypothetical protein
MLAFIECRQFLRNSLLKFAAAAVSAAEVRGDRKVRMRGEFFYSTIFIGNGSDIHTEQ